jgi:hypothetical protein
MKALIAAATMLCLGSIGFYGFVCAHKPAFGLQRSQSFFKEPSETLPPAGAHTFSESHGRGTPTRVAKPQASVTADVANIYDQKRGARQTIDSQSRWTLLGAPTAIESTPPAQLEREQRQVAEEFLVAPEERPLPALRSTVPRDAIVFGGRGEASLSSQFSSLAVRGLATATTNSQGSDIPAEHLGRQRDTTDTAPGQGIAPAPDDAEEALHPSEALFTTDEQHYRSLYGSAVFYAAKLEQAKQAAGTQ